MLQPTYVILVSVKPSPHLIQPNDVAATASVKRQRSLQEIENCISFWVLNKLENVQNEDVIILNKKARF